LRTNAFFKNVKELKKLKPEIMILTKMHKRYKKQLNSKYMKLKKYNRFMFDGTDTEIFVKEGKYEL